MPDDVKIKLRASLGLDASDVAKSMQAIQEQLKPKYEQAATEADISKDVHQWLQKTLGASTSYLESRRKLLVTYREEVRLVRDIEHELDRVRKAQAGKGWTVAGDKREKFLSMQAGEGRMFTDSLQDAIRSGMAGEQAGGKGGGQSEIQKMATSAVGGLAGGLVGKLLPGILTAVANPWVAVPLVGALAAKFLKGQADEYSEYSEKLDVGFENTGRRMGYGTDLRGKLETGGPGRVSPRMKALGYTGEDVLKMSDAYSMKGKGFEAALDAQGGFARAFGYGQNPEAISGMGRRATQLGMSDQPAFWRTMTEAVMTGQKHGIDASETMRALLGLTEDVAAHTGVVSHDYLSGLSGIQKAFEGGMSKFFKGETGAQQLKTVMDAFMHPQGIAQQRFTMNAVREYFGGKTPTAKELGFSDASGYDEMTELQKSQDILAQLPKLMKNPKTAGLFAHIARTISKAAPPGGEMLMWQSYLGMPPEKLHSMKEALAGIVGGKDAGTRGFGDLLATAFKKAPDQARKALAGQAAPSEITPMEQKEQLQRETMEAFSTAISTSTFNIRKFTEQLEASTTSLAADLINSGHEGTLGDTIIKSIFPYWRKGGSKGGSTGGSTDGGKGREQLLTPQAEATPQLQGWSGSSMQMQPLLISGTIELTGAGEGTVPAAMFLPILKQAIEQSEARMRSMGTSRSRQMGTVGI